MEEEIIDEDLYYELCEQADYWGEDSLTEDEQFAILQYQKWRDGSDIL